MTIQYHPGKLAWYAGSRFGGPGVRVMLVHYSSVWHCVVDTGPHEGVEFIAGMRDVLPWCDGNFERALEQRAEQEGIRSMTRERLRAEMHEMSERMRPKTLRERAALLFRKAVKR